MSQPRRILMIDDEPEWIRPHAEALEEEGCAVTRMMDVDDAIRLLEKEPFDLIVLDLLMPPPAAMGRNFDFDTDVDLRETGVWLHREIREHLGIQNVPIIIMSVVRDKEIRDKINAVERNYGNRVYYRTKPILPSDLINEVERVLR